MGVKDWGLRIGSGGAREDPSKECVERDVVVEISGFLAAKDKCWVDCYFHTALLSESVLPLNYWLPTYSSRETADDITLSCT